MSRTSSVCSWNEYIDCEVLTPKKRLNGRCRDRFETQEPAHATQPSNSIMASTSAGTGRVEHYQILKGFQREKTTLVSPI